MLLVRVLSLAEILKIKDGGLKMRYATLDYLGYFGFGHRVRIRLMISAEFREIQLLSRRVRKLYKPDLKELGEIYAVTLGINPHHNPLDKRSG